MESIVKEYGVKYLTHFTQVNNLSSIFNNGILPISELKHREIEYIWNDADRIDDCHNASCFSIGFPNYKMFYPLRLQNPNIDWVVLGIKKEVLWEKDCAFCKENAASNNERFIPLGRRRGAIAFHRMFEEYPGQPSRRQMRLPNNLPTHPQAEVLVFGEVEPSYIIGVAFENEIIKERNKHLVPSDFEMRVRNKYFRARDDYEHWR